MTDLLPRIVLVHGSFHGPWCWARLAPLLQATGFRITAPDLLSAGRDAGLDGYARIVEQAIDETPEPVIVIGHSMGGLVTSAVCERRPDRVLGAIYIAGLLLRDGETLTRFLDAHVGLGVEDLVLKHMQIDNLREVANFPRPMAREVFYNCCSEADAAWAADQLRAQPVAVYGDPLSLTAGRYGRVPRVYIGALSDHAVSPAYQRAMTERTPCDQTLWLDSDHSPFLSQPVSLAETLEPILARLLLRDRG